MSTNQTKNYGLSQWEPNDDFLRTEFNENLAKIDAVLAEKCGVVTGTYVGDDTAERFIDLGFTPKAVFLCTEEGQTHHSSSYTSSYGGLALPESPIAISGTWTVRIVEGGFEVRQDTPRRYNTNSTHHTYHYFAIR